MMKPTYFYTLLALSLLLVLTNSCEKTEPKNDKNSLNTAQLFSYLPADTIDPNSAIQLRFTAPIKDLEEKLKAASSNFFKLSPNVEGELSSSDNQTIIFKSNVPFTSHKNYKINLSPSALSTTLNKAKDLELKLHIKGPRVMAVDGDFEPVNINKPGLVHYVAKVRFNQNINLEKLKTAIQIKLGNKNLKFTLQKGTNAQEYEVKSAAIVRHNKAQQLQFIINKNPLGFPTEIRQEATLYSITKFEVHQAKFQVGDKSRQLVIRFSDRPDKDQNRSGFISISPALEFTSFVRNNNLIINAPFNAGTEYTVEIHKGLRNKWGHKISQKFSKKLRVKDIKPEIQFTQSGMFLPSVNNQSISFSSVNVSHVNIIVTKVYESNLGQYLQMERISSKKKNNQQFSYNIDRVGNEVYRKKVHISNEKNRWLQNQIDLSSLFNEEKNGIYLLEVNFNKEDMLYNKDENSQEYQRQRNRYNNPQPGDYYYMRNHARIYKPVLLSDMGITVKKAGNDYHVFVTDLLSAKPLSGAEVTFYSYQNQILQQQTTNSEGVIKVSLPKQKPFYIAAEKDDQKSFIKPAEMAWNLSGYDISGTTYSNSGLKIFSYGDRGVYRPGDSIFVSLIVRNQDHTFPKDHPIKMVVRNPLNQIVHTIQNKTAQDGFYSFKFNTNNTDITGNYSLTFNVGSSTHSHTVKVETVVPEKLKIKLTPQKEHIAWNDQLINIPMEVSYLFGNPAAGLEVHPEYTLSPSKMAFNRFKEFSFNLTAKPFRYETRKINPFKLDKKGKHTLNWTIPQLKDAPARLMAEFSIKVFEPGGRFSKKILRLPYNRYPYFIGLKKPKFEWGNAQLGNSYQIPVIVVNEAGKAIEGKSLNYTVYQNSTNWWWEYNSREQFQLRYRESSSTKQVQTGTLVSTAHGTDIPFKPEQRGTYLIEVRDPVHNGQVLSYYVQASPWGSDGMDNKNAGSLKLSRNKANYNIGETAQITFPAPKKGMVLFTLEKANTILEQKWVTLNGTSNQITIPIKTTAQMAPTVYASISILQPHAETQNDRPIRSYGVIPIPVHNAESKQALSITMPQELKSEQPFSVKLQSSDGKPSQFTIAVVDEGLLSLTNFKTPNPWHFFNKKERLSINTYDMYNHVIGANFGDIFKRFSIGGGLDAFSENANQESPKQAQRFKPVAMFKGPISTDEKGAATVHFKMPRYIGAVRVMVVNSNGVASGSTEKSVPVKTDLMVLPTLPRQLAPGDVFSLPISIFAMKEKIGKTTISLQVEGPLSVDGKSTQQLHFNSKEEKDILFNLKVAEEVGLAKVKITATGQNSQAIYETELDVRAASQMEFKAQFKEVAKGSYTTFTIPKEGIKGSSKAELVLRTKPDFNFGTRLYQLINYPYGCIEQTTSSVFSQLYLGALMPPSKLAQSDITQNINSGINRLKKFALPSGGMSYWPGNRDVSHWGSSYAFHFLSEARNAGYHVPEKMYKNLQTFQTQRANRNVGGTRSALYRIYTLAISGKAPIGAMNLMYENKLAALNDTERWLLATSYEKAGMKEIAQKIIKNSGIKVAKYREFSGTYGSDLRDKALILNMMLHFNKTKKAQPIIDELAQVIRSNRWLSTQEGAFMLMALGKYAQRYESNEATSIAGNLIWEDGTKQPFKMKKEPAIIDLSQHFGKAVKLEVAHTNSSAQLFSTLQWQGHYLKSSVKNLQKNITLKVAYYDDFGNKLDPTQLKQGSSFWAHYTMQGVNRRTKVDELALTQLLPSGWEIENTRLNNETLPSWTDRIKQANVEYTDIRDDRISWFFDLYSFDTKKEFLVKLNAITVGSFWLPAAHCQAMYNNDYRATTAGKWVNVVAR